MAIALNMTKPRAETNSLLSVSVYSCLAIHSGEIYLISPYALFQIFQDPLLLHEHKQ
jgi:hypothetical protein